MLYLICESSSLLEDVDLWLCPLHFQITTLRLDKIVEEVSVVVLETRSLHF